MSRAGQKLEAALTTFSLDVTNRRAIDVGASTGGFTDCMLQRDIASVVALDVGYGQLHWRIRNDARVEVIERTNIRHADPEHLGSPFDLIVADLSFISLRTVASQIRALGGDGSDWILLIKPQFEAGRDKIGKGGIVRDPAVRCDVVKAVVGHFDDIGLGCSGIIVSPITGATGNTEFVAWFRRTTGTVDEESIEALTKGTTK